MERKANFNLTDTGDLEGTLTITFTGLEALQRRVEERNEDAADKKKYLEDQAQEYVPAACEVDLTNQPDWSSSSPQLVAEYKLQNTGLGGGRRTARDDAGRNFQRDSSGACSNIANAFIRSTSNSLSRRWMTSAFRFPWAGRSAACRRRKIAMPS